MKKQALFTAIAIVASMALPACSSTKHHEPKVEHEVISGDPATGNYVEVLTEKGFGFNKKTTVTHSTEVERVAGTVKNPGQTVRTVKETNVRKVIKDGKEKIEKSETQSRSVIPAPKK